MTETYVATVDRIVDDRTAVLLLEADGETVDQFDVDASDLPAEGRHEGAVFDVRVDDGTIVEAAYRPEDTRSREESAQERLDRLSTDLSDRE